MFTHAPNKIKFSRTHLRFVTALVVFALIAGVIPAFSSSVGVSTVDCTNPGTTTYGNNGWTRPSLENPTTINLGQGPTYTNLEECKDYIINLPPYKKEGTTWITGGRNVHIIGGYVTIPKVEGRVGIQYSGEQRAIYIKDNEGIVHIEGVLIDGSGGSEIDGIAINAPESIVQVQNTRIVGITGRDATNHADIIQPWGGVKELRVDRLTGSSDYQGLFVRQDLGPIGKLDFRRVNLKALTPAGSTRTIGYMLVFYTGGGGTVYSGCQGIAPTNLQDFYIEPRTGGTLSQAVMPDAKAGSTECPLVLNGNIGSWPKVPQIKGSVTKGKPEKDFVPEGSVGNNYKGLIDPVTLTTPTLPPVTVAPTLPPVTVAPTLPPVTVAPTLPPVTVTTTLPITDNAMAIARSSIISTYDLAKLSINSSTASSFSGRAYFKYYGFLYMVIDIKVTVNINGTYLITEAIPILSFTPIS